ncbi:hypothetical protein CUMW_282720, partial [Citrus unshiu]
TTIHKAAQLIYVHVSINYSGLLRCDKSCRSRWINYLHPHLKCGNFTNEEDKLIIKLYRRTNNEIKNFWNTHIKRKLLNHGLDPQTHHPSTKFITIIFSTNILLIIMKK